MEFNWLNATEPLWGNSLLCTTKSPGVPGNNLIDLGWWKAESILEPPGSFESGTLGWEIRCWGIGDPKNDVPVKSYKWSYERLIVIHYFMNITVC